MRLGLQEEHFSPIRNVGGEPYRHKEEPFTREVFLFLVQKEQRLERKRTKGLAGLGYALCFSERSPNCLLKREKEAVLSPALLSNREKPVSWLQQASWEHLGSILHQEPEGEPQQQGSPSSCTAGRHGEAFHHARAISSAGGAFRSHKGPHRHPGSLFEAKTPQTKTQEKAQTGVYRLLWGSGSQSLTPYFSVVLFLCTTIF